MKPVFRAPGTQENPQTVEQVIAGYGKQIISVETEHAFYVANTLTEALRLWSNANDNSPVLNIHTLG